MSEMALEVPGRMLGAFAELGGQMFYVDWSPEPRQVEGAFAWLAGYVENIEYPMVFSLLTAQHDTRERFLTESDPDGADWTPLDPDYLNDKLAAGFPEDILIRTGALEEAAPFGWRIVGESLFYDTSGLPFYGPLHQTGTGDPEDWGAGFESRELVRSRKVIKSFLEEEERPGSVKASLGIGRGSALPARPFIGLSPEAIEEIAMIFDKWYDIGPEVMPWRAEPLAPTPMGGGESIVQRMTSGLAISRTETIEYRAAAYGGGFSVRGAKGRFVGAFIP